MKVQTNAERGYIRGKLDAGEDHACIVSLLHHFKNQLLDNTLELKVHEHLLAAQDVTQIEMAQTKKLALLYQDKLKRCVVAVETSAGPRIVKISQAGNFRTSVAGALSQSVANREHRYQVRTQALSLAAAESKGYLELWHGPLLVRSCQVQIPMSDSAVVLGDHVTQMLITHREEAMLHLAQAMAHTHQKNFFHADLKGFHAIVVPGSSGSGYTLRWLDLARVGFSLSRRRRIINLYQMLRFVVPEQGELQDAFMRHYCLAAQWYPNDANKAIRLVGRFLEHKLRTHPNP